MRPVSAAVMPLVVALTVGLLASCRHAAPPVGETPVTRPEVSHAERVVWQGDIAHYTYDLRTGPGQFDAVRVHRLVRETAPGHRILTRSVIFMLPGSPNFFAAIFMAPSVSDAVGREHALAAFLAAGGVDVWGMDYGWALVPAETSDLAFMQEWGVARDVRDTALALAFARATRAEDRQPDVPLHLLGFSYGGVVAYAVAGGETQRPAASRDVAGLVILDVGLGLPGEDQRAFHCQAASSDRATLASGVHSDETGLFLGQLGQLALATPGEPSPHLQGLTNRQAALAFGASTESINKQFWHFVGGDLDENGIPSGLRFTSERLWLDLLGAIPPHLPARTNLDVDATFCGAEDVPFDDHLADIALPILYVGAAGGIGPAGEPTARQTASRDVTSFVIRRLPAGQERADFGHADIVLAADAPRLAWQPILDWVRAHQ